MDPRQLRPSDGPRHRRRLRRQFDSYDEVSYGGTGKSFDLSLLKGLIEIPLLVAGGIEEINFHNARLMKNCSGLDICSGVEDASNAG